MKKHILLLGIFLSLTVFLSVQAGNTVIDSLKQEIRQAEREPSSKEKLIEFTTVQRNYPIGSVDLNRNHSSDVLV